MDQIEKTELYRLLTGELWSNSACCGYLILACEKQGIDGGQIDALLKSMKVVFESVPIKTAEKVYMSY